MEEIWLFRSMEGWSFTSGISPGLSIAKGSPMMSRGSVLDFWNFIITQDPNLEEYKMIQLMMSPGWQTSCMLKEIESSMKKFSL